MQDLPNSQTGSIPLRARTAWISDGERFTIRRSYTYPSSGITLFTGQHLRGRNKGQFATGWILPDSDLSRFYKSRLSEKDATALFLRLKKEAPPSTNAFKEDPQVNLVYRWEDKFRSKTRKIAPQDMVRITGQLAAAFNMAAPGIVFQPDPKSKIYAEADLANNLIILYRPRLAFLLHEFSHLVDHQINQNKWGFHGPGFVRTYLSVLAMFPEIGDIKAMERDALNMNVKIARARDIPACLVMPQTKTAPTLK